LTGSVRNLEHRGWLNESGKPEWCTDGLTSSLWRTRTAAERGKRAIRVERRSRARGENSQIRSGLIPPYSTSVSTCQM
jgi:hypothetical protein